MAFQPTETIAAAPMLIWEILTAVPFAAGLQRRAETRAG